MESWIEMGCSNRKILYTIESCVGRLLVFIHIEGLNNVVILN